MLDEALDAMIRRAVADAVAPLERELRALRAAVGAGAGRWCDRRAAAEALAISTDTVDRMVARGALRSRRLGRRISIFVEPPAPADEIGRLAAAARGERP